MADLLAEVQARELNLHPDMAVGEGDVEGLHVVVDGDGIIRRCAYQRRSASPRQRPCRPSDTRSR